MLVGDNLISTAKLRIFHGQLGILQNVALMAENLVMQLHRPLNIILGLPFPSLLSNYGSMFTLQMLIFISTCRISLDSLFPFGKWTDVEIFRLSWCYHPESIFPSEYAFTLFDTVRFLSNMLRRVNINMQISNTYFLTYFVA